VNDGINNDDFPTKMSSTTAWLRVLNQAGAGCWISKTDWADAYKQFPVHREDLPLQWFEWGGRYFVELCLIFGGVSSAGIFDDGAKLFVEMGCLKAKFPRSMICQHLDDICGAAGKDSGALHRLETAFTEIANFTGIKLAPKTDVNKAFGPRKNGTVFGIYYDTETWTWAVATEKLARILEQIELALAADTLHEKEVKSLIGKLIHIKALIPTSRFNADHIMQWLSDSNNLTMVPVLPQCKRQLHFWYQLLVTTNGSVAIPDTISGIPPWAVPVFCDAASGSNCSAARGSGGVCGPLWYFHQWAAGINSGRLKWDEKKIGRKLTALELIGPLIFISTAPAAFRRTHAVFWIDNAGSVAVWKKGYSPHCSMSSTIVKAIATVAAAIGSSVHIEKITRCSNTGAVLADALSKAEFAEFFRIADTAGWSLCQEPLSIPTPLLKWLADPTPDDDLGAKICNHLSAEHTMIGR